MFLASRAGLGMYPLTRHRPRLSLLAFCLSALGYWLPFNSLRHYWSRPNSTKIAQDRRKLTQDKRKMTQDSSKTGPRQVQVDRRQAPGGHAICSNNKHRHHHRGCPNRPNPTTTISNSVMRPKPFSGPSRPLLPRQRDFGPKWARRLGESSIRKPAGRTPYVIRASQRHKDTLLLSYLLAESDLKWP